MKSRKWYTDLELNCKAEIEAHKCREQRYGHQVSKGGQGMDGLGDWDWHIYLTVYKKIINENQLYSTGNSTQCSLVT